MIARRALKPRTARTVWSKYLDWVKRTQITKREKSETRAISLIIPNNIFASSIKNTLTLFVQSLTFEEQVGLPALNGNRSLGVQYVTRASLIILCPLCGLT